MEAKRCIYVSVNYAIIVLDNGLSPNQCQAIFLANAALLSTGPWHSNANAIQNSTIFIYKETHFKKIQNIGHLPMAVNISLPSAAYMC